MSNNSFLRGLPLTFISQLLVSIIGILTLSVFAHLLPKDEMGIFLIIRRTVTFLVPIFTLNLGLSLAKYGSINPQNIINYFLNFIGLIIIIFFLSLIPIYNFQDKITNYLFQSGEYNNSLIPLFIFLFVNLIHNLTYNLYRGLQNYKLMNLINLFFGVSGLCALIILFLPLNLTTNKVNTFYYLYSIILILIDLFFLIKSNEVKSFIKSLNKFNWKAEFKIFNYGISRIPSGLFLASIFTIPILLSDSLELAASIGIVLSIYKILQLIAFPFNVILLPEITKLKNENNNEVIKYYSVLSLELIFTLLTYLSLLIYFFIPELIKIGFSINYDSIIGPLKLIVPFIGLFLGYIILRGIIDGLYEKPYINYINFIGAAVLIVLGLVLNLNEIVLILIFGFSTSLLGILSILFIKVKLKINIFSKNSIIGLMLNLFFFLTFYNFDFYFNSNKPIIILSTKLVLTIFSLLISILVYRQIKISWYSILINSSKNV